jgi:hypothetical protein
MSPREELADRVAETNADPEHVTVSTKRADAPPASMLSKTALRTGVAAPPLERPTYPPS